MDRDDLVRWLDKELHQNDVNQEKMEEWIRRAVMILLSSGALTCQRLFGQSIFSAESC